MFNQKTCKFGLILLLFLALPVWAKSDKKILYNQGGLIITETKATYKGRVLYDAVKDLKDQHKKKEECAGDIVNIYTPLSLVGPYFSYQTHVYQFSGSDGSKSSSNYKYRTVNLKSNAKVSILDLVEEASLVAALQKDPWVRKHSRGKLKQLKSCESFKEFLQTFALDEKSNYGFTDTSFAFLEFDPQTGLAALRLLGNENSKSGYNKSLELGLLVEPKINFRKLFGLKANFYYGQFQETSHTDAR